MTDGAAPAGRSEFPSTQFPSTQWTVVVAAGDELGASAEEALAALCETYWYPLYALARRLGSPPEAAEDLTQGFFAHLLEKGALASADPDRGRFRAFLRTAFRNFVGQRREAARAHKRGGGRRILSLDLAAGERRYLSEPVDDLTPERLYDRQWALLVMERALDRVGEQLERTGSGALFRAIRPVLEGGTNVDTHAQIAERIGSTPAAVRQAVSRARRRYADHIRAEIAETVATAGEVEDEVAALLRALRG